MCTHIQEKRKEATALTIINKDTFEGIAPYVSKRHHPLLILMLAHKHKGNKQGQIAFLNISAAYN